jgi:hypothetical protein
MKRALALVASLGLCALLSACEQKGGPLKVDNTEPAQGTTAGGEEITINGGGFVSGKTQASVTFGRKKAEHVMIVSPTKIKVITPANEKGPVDVKVDFDDGQAFKIANGFRYVEPATGDNTRRAFFGGDKAAPGAKIEIEKK